MNKEKRLYKLVKYYTSIELLKSYIAGVIFFVVPTSLFIILFANIVVLYVPYLIYLLLVLYIVLIGLAIFSSKVQVETLSNYQDKSEVINLKMIYYKLSLIAIVNITIVFIIGYQIYLSFN